MVTVEVNIGEGDKEPDQNLDPGEHIERVTVPLDQLYNKLKGMSIPFLPPSLQVLSQATQLFRKRRARSSMRGRWFGISSYAYCNH